MSYTNSTPNLHLPQYIATDKPTYLGDWNASMQTIDTVITSTQATANGASSTATSANSIAQAAQKTANEANIRSQNNATDITEINNNLTKKVIAPNSNMDFTGVSVAVEYNSAIATISFSTAVTSLTGKGTVSGSNTYVKIFSINQNIFNLETDTITGTNFRGFYSFSYRHYGDNLADEITSNLYVRCYWDGANTVFYGVIPTSTITTEPNVSAWGAVAVIM